MPNYGGFGGGMPNFDQQQYAQAQQQWAQQAQQQQSDPNGFYSALDIPNNASAKDVKSAYRKLALKYHVSIRFCRAPTVDSSCALLSGF